MAQKDSQSMLCIARAQGLGNSQSPVTASLLRLCHSGSKVSQSGQTVQPYLTIEEIRLSTLSLCRQ